MSLTKKAVGGESKSNLDSCVLFFELDFVDVALPQTDLSPHGILAHRRSEVQYVTELIG